MKSSPMNKRETYIKSEEFESACDVWRLLALKGEVEQYDCFRDDIGSQELGTYIPDVLFCRVKLTNGQDWHSPVFGNDEQS